MASPHETPPPGVLMHLITGKFVTQSVATIAELKVCDHMKDGPRTSDDLAKECGADPDALYRVMRLLASVGVFTEKDGRSFTLTPVGNLLRTDVPGSLAAFAAFVGASFHNGAWTQLTHSVRTGNSGFTKQHGKPVFEWCESHPAEWAIFNAAMTGVAQMGLDAVLKAYDFSQFKAIADVGGGHGALLSAILKAAPQARGILFDLPQVVEGAKKTFAANGLASRCEIVGGDFFKSVPGNCDAYVMKSIIHDWSDDRAITILKNCASNLTKGGKVILLEQVMTPPGVPGMARLLDLEMLVMTEGGRERTEAEFGSIFAKAGLKLTRCVSTQSPVTVVEAEKA
jgi:hypothetical protein